MASPPPTPPPSGGSWPAPTARIILEDWPADRGKGSTGDRDRDPLAPASGGMAFRLEVVVFGAPVGTTQTVALVQGTITNQVGGKVVAATDRMLVVTNAPGSFRGTACGLRQRQRARSPWWVPA